MVKYVYDAWGNCKTTVIDENATAIAEMNPFRYRSYYFDVETNFYFLKTRYYDSEIGRFITIDDISYLEPVSINGLNLYIYCLNDPIMYVDPTGQSFWEWLEDVKELIQRMKCPDGSYALYDNHRHNRKSKFHEQILAFTPSGPSFNLKEGNVGLGSLSVDALTGGWEGEHANLSLLDFGHAEASAEMKDGQVSVGALASIWSPSFSVTFLGITVEVGAEVGAIGAGIDIGKKGFKAKGAYAFGASFSVSW